jgi:arylsulfatase A-like enzyme
MPPAERPPTAAAGGHPGAPNVLYVVFEDASIAAWDAFGGLIDMPNMKRLAARGLRYSQWHTPALSALTRSCLLTVCARDADRGARQAGRAGPRRNGVIPLEERTLAEILAEHGYRTYCVGKWQLSAAEAFGMAGSRRAWPLRRGFDRYYGFLGSQTSNWYPDLVYDNQYVDQPYPPADGYHLSRDLADTAVDFLRDGSRTAPGRPWLCYLSFGANDAPQGAPRKWIGNYRGRFGMGYDRYREIVLGNMKRLGVVPGSAELAPVDRWPTGAPGSEASPRRPWRALSDEQRQLSHRDAESYAGLCSYNDHQVGRLLDYLEESGQLDDTIVVACSANAAGSGLDVYPAGWAWAFRTPYNALRQQSPGGSVPSPLIISWPREMRDVTGGVRDQYHHAADLVPTILGCVGRDAADRASGQPQLPTEGVSMRYTFAAPDAPSARLVQRYEAAGARAIYAGGWKAIAGPGQAPAGRNGAAGAWELYHVAEDRAELQDLAASCPAKAAELASLWDAPAAGRNAGSPAGVPARVHRGATGSGRSASLRPRTGPAAARR